MDERTLEVIIKAQNETKAAFAEIQAQLAALQTQTAAATGGQGILGFVSALAALMPGGTVMGYAILGVIGLAVALAPLAVALGAVIANTIAWATIATVAITAIGGLAGAIFLLGAANAGGLSPATEMVKEHNALLTAIKNHAKALEELKLAQSGVDIYDLGKGSKAENVRLARAYVTATTANLADAQHDYREPASGLGGPIAGLGSAVDDMTHHFEAASRPFAEHIAMWTMQFLPAIEKAGDAILKWFGQRMPDIFATMSVIVASLSGFFGSLFTTVGKVIDYVLAHRSEFEAFWKSFLGVAAAAFDGVMNAMMNIADWFRTNWPAISHAASVAAKAIGDGFNFWLPMIKQELPFLGRQLQDIGKHIEDLKPLWEAFGFVVGSVLQGVITALSTVLGAIQAIEAGLRAIQQLGHGIQGPIGPGAHPLNAPGWSYPGAGASPGSGGGRNSGSGAGI